MTPNLVCRTCLTDRGDLVEVFSDCGEELALVIKLKDHLNLEVRNVVMFYVHLLKRIPSRTMRLIRIRPYATNV